MTQNNTHYHKTIHYAHKVAGLAAVRDIPSKKVQKLYFVFIVVIQRVYEFLI